MSDTANITGIHFSRLTLSTTVDLVANWATDDQMRGKCLAVVNPHSVETARRDPEFAAAIRAADLVTPSHGEDRGWWVVNCTLLDGVPLIDNRTVHR